VLVVGFKFKSVYTSVMCQQNGTLKSSRYEKAENHKQMSSVRAKHRWRITWPSLVLFLGFAFCVIPVFSLLKMALFLENPSGHEQLMHLLQFVVPHAALQTFLLLIGVAVLAGVMGTLSAWIITLYRFRGRTVLMWLLPLPLAVPTYITAYCYVEIFEFLGPVQTGLRSVFGWTLPSEYFFPRVRSLGGAILIMSSVVYPYIYLAARVMFASQSANLLEAARTMGTTSWHTFLLVAFPLARPALAVGLSLALLEVLNDVGASEYLGINTLTLIVMNTWLNVGNLGGAALVALLLLVLVACLMAFEAYGRRHKGFVNADRHTRLPTPLSLTKKTRYWMFGLCALPPFLGFILPLGFLLKTSWERHLFQKQDVGFGSAALNSFGYALCTTLILIVFGGVIALAHRTLRSRMSALAVRLTSIGYAIPGSVLALGLMLPLVGLSHALVWGAQQMGITLTAPLILGTSAALLIAYSIRFMSLATQSICTGYDRVSLHLDMAARTLGSTYLHVIWRIHRPLMLPAFASAALIVFVDCLKELPVTLLLRPLNVETLATQLYALASQGQFENGSLLALTLVLFGVIPVLLLTHLTHSQS
jgi:iron(III) transport system permease protein